MKAIAFARLHDCAVDRAELPGLLSPAMIKLGVMPASPLRARHVGVISRSGTLTYEIVDQLTRAGLGQSTIIGIGGDPVIGQTFTDVLRRFEDDDQTRAVVIIGEVGGSLEEEGRGRRTSPSPLISRASLPPRRNGWVMQGRSSKEERATPVRRSND